MFLPPMFLFIYYLMCMGVYLHVYVCTVCVVSVEVRRGCPAPRTGSQLSVNAVLKVPSLCHLSSPSASHPALKCLCVGLCLAFNF